MEEGWRHKIANMGINRHFTFPTADPLFSERMPGSGEVARISGSSKVWSSVSRVRSTIASISASVQQSGGA